MPRKRRLKVPLGYRRKECTVCGAPFILGPLDPEISVCPLCFASGRWLSEGKLSKKERRMLEKYASSRK